MRSAADLLPVVRFIYRGESLRNGRVVQLDATAVAVGDDERPVILGHHLLRALEEDESNVDLVRFAPFVYSKALEGWSPLRPDAAVPLHRTEHESPVRRAEVMLELRQPAPAVPPGTDACSLATAATVAAATVGGAAADGGALVPRASAEGDALAPRAAAPRGE